MKNLRQLLRSKWFVSKKRRGRPDSSSKVSQRRLSNEALEKRELLAGDILASNHFHNTFAPYDVNADGQYSASDALAVINYMGRNQASGESSAEPTPGMFLDVNADSRVTAADALSVINALGRGEAVGEYVELLLNARTADDQTELTPDPTSGAIELDVDERFLLEVSYDELFSGTRPPAPGNPMGAPNTPVDGAFQVFTDLMFSNNGSAANGQLEPVLGETQRLIFGDELFDDQNDPNGPGAGATVVFSIEGSTDTFTSTAANFQQRALVETRFALQSFGYSPNEFLLTGLEFNNGDQGIQIVYTGSDLLDMDLPDVMIETRDYPLAVPTNFQEFLPRDPTTGEVNGDNIRFNINTFSRTFQTNGFNDPGNPGNQFYELQNVGSYDPVGGFTEIGGIGGVPSSGGGISDLDSRGFYDDPFDAFSLLVKFTQPVTNFTTSVVPQAGNNEALLLYGEDIPIPASLILVDEDATVTFNVAGPQNNAPVITVGAGNSDSGSVNETDATNLTASGTLSVEDLDTADTVSAAVSTVSAVGNTGGLTNATLLAMMTVGANPVIDAASTTGTINWNFNSGSEAFNHLGDGETLQLTYTLSATDTKDTDTQTVVITVNGQNDQPNIFVGSGDTSAGGFTENGMPNRTVSGTLSVEDQDVSDVVSSGVASVSSVGDTNGIPNATLLSMMSVAPTTAINGTNTTGSVTWTFNSGSETFSHLEMNDTLELTYTLSATDDSGATTEPNSDSQTVTITIMGANDIVNAAPVITVNAGNGDSDTGGVTESDSPNLMSSGTLSVEDLDMADVVNAAVDSVMATSGPTNGIPNATFLQMMTVGANPVIDASSTTGTINWSFNSGAETFDHIALGESLVLTYTLSATDSIATDTQTVAITVTGTNDEPTAADNRNSIVKDSVTPATGNVITDVDATAGVDNDLDASDVLTVTDLSGESNPANDVTGTFGTLDWAAAGGYSYTVDTTNPTVQALGPDDTPLVDTFTYTISDGNGGSDTATLTISVTGVNDPPMAQDNRNEIDEDASAPVTGNVITDVDPIAGVDTDANGDTLTVIDFGGVTNPATNVTGSVGSLDWSADGGYSYSLDNTNPIVQALAQGATLTDTFTYTISDGRNGTDSATLTITVNGVNDAPVATNNQQTVSKGAFVDATGNVITDNDGFGVDSDVDTGDVLSVSGINGVTNPATDVTGSFGSLNWESNGGYTYTIDSSNPSVQALGPNDAPLVDTFTYTVDDGSGAANSSDTATLQISITAINPSTASGFIFIDHVENVRDVIDNDADPIRNGVKDSDEAGLGGLRVTLFSAASDNTTGQVVDVDTFTDASGAYDFSGLAPGVYTVTPTINGQTLSESSHVIPLAGPQFVITIPNEGGQTFVDLNFPIMNTSGAALSTVNLLASSYLDSNGELRAATNNGREGGLFSLDSSGDQNFFQLGEGFDGIKFAELALNAERDEALLTVVDESDVARTARLSQNQFVVANGDGFGVQFFGGLDDIDLFPIASELEAEYPTYLDAIMAADNAGVIDLF